LIYPLAWSEKDIKNANGLIPDIYRYGREGIPHWVPEAVMEWTPSRIGHYRLIPVAFHHRFPAFQRFEHTQISTAFLAFH
jgi:hypothetical protein